MYISENKQAILIVPVVKSHAAQFLKSQSAKTSHWLGACDFKANSGQYCLIPGDDGCIEKVILGLNNVEDTNAYAMAALSLPVGDYYVEHDLSLNAIIQWGLAQYHFDRYKENTEGVRNLVAGKKDIKEAQAIIDAINVVRDLINTPCEDMGPKDLSQVMQSLADTHQGEFSEIVGEALLDENYPAVHTVGRAAADAPRLLTLSWGNKKHPKLCLVGKGVCFDSGGLDIKPASGMRLMKKDMGGAANAIGLAMLIMTLKLPIQLELIIPAVENAIASNAYRPGDILKTRKGLSVEVGNTDAEGRLVLADALTLASEKKPKLIIDFATLTGAARVAVGTGIAAMFSNDDKVAEALLKGAFESADTICRLPLHQAYLPLIQPQIADLSNTGASPYGGAITAALFLEQFIDKAIPWVHFDIMAWNTQALPGKPEGGEAMGLLACYQALKTLFL